MQIYIADLQAYNSGYLKGEWIKLPTEEDDIQDAILRQSQNVQSDFAIHDWELPFEISEYTNPLKINELCHTIQELNLNKYLIQHLEYAYGVDLKNTDTYTLKNYLDNIYTIEASNNIEFAQNFIYEFYFDQIEALPWEISYRIDYETLYKKLEMTMNITKNEYENIYYYSNN